MSAAAGDKRGRIWGVYAACVALVVVGLGALTFQVVRLEAREDEALAQKTRDELTRRALWRLDSQLAPMIAAEARRPYFDYRGVRAAGRAYEQALTPAGLMEPVEASALLLEASEERDSADGVLGDRFGRSLVVVRFQVEPDGRVTSPAAPTPSELARLISQQPSIEVDSRAVASASAALVRVRELVGSLGDAQPMVDQMREAIPVPTEAVLGASTAAPGVDAQEGGRERSGYAGTQDRDLAARRQIADIAQNVEPEGVNEAERALKLTRPEETDAEMADASAPTRAARSSRAEDLLDDAGVTETLAESARADKPSGETAYFAALPQARARGLPGGPADAGGTVEVGAMRPVWVRPPDEDAAERELMMVRRVLVGDAAYTQGVWLDWRSLRATLLESVSDLAPTASLVAVGGTAAAVPGAEGESGDASEMLATIPARFEFGGAVALPSRGMTPARWGLVLTWGALAVAAIATALSLRASLRLADRRGKFVSAVTHELRTPLTSFRLYSQMLAGGMVKDEDAKREYLGTLERESSRLAEVVENVLAYARLDRANARPRRVDAVEPEALLARVRPGLSRRAERDGMDLVVSADLNEARGRRVSADPASVERILMNLVENACKYGVPESGSAETRIHLDVRARGDVLELLVADYGPGIPPAERSRVFGEFQRGRAGALADKRSAAGGLGLGLALARGLAREGGGDLALVRRRGHGAEFLLTLPLVDAGAAGVARGGEAGPPGGGGLK